MNQAPSGFRNFFGKAGRLGDVGLRSKLMFGLIPAILAILCATGYVSYRLSGHFITIALERNARIRNLAMAHDLETLLDRCRQNLLFAARLPLNRESMAEFMAATRESGGIAFREFAFVSFNGRDHVYLVQDGDKVHAVGPDGLGSIRPNPLLYAQRIGPMRPGEVLPSAVTAVEWPFPTDKNAGGRLEGKVIRFATPVPASGPSGPGLLFLSVSVAELRQLLSVHNSPQSPVWGFPRSPELRFSYLFDSQGWILFQSEDPEHPELPLATYLARDGFTGTLGRPELAGAFRPSTGHGDFWFMVEEVQAGRHGIMKAKGDGSDNGASHFAAYAPILFRPGPGMEPMVLGGVVFVDRSQLTMVAGYKYFDAMLVITLLSMLLICLVVYVLGRIVTRPLFRLAREVQRIQGRDELGPIDLRVSGAEIATLVAAINEMLSRIRLQMEEIRVRDAAILNVNLKERAPLEEETAALLAGEDQDDPIPEIVGAGPAMRRLKTQILKAAQTDVDVLIEGETGTGKQLAAEAVHTHGHRSGMPFVSVNCGALDENLLLDTLFGHVKGAFTEAKSDRMGAFVKAQGGTLFLDEIQNASPRVQQSLLRALAARKIKPLGSDAEIDVDVRLVAATNVDLKSLIAKGVFREDLYYRLKVLAIHTPTLRSHRPNISLLALHYLRQAEQLVNRENLGLSKGAVEKILNYDWPGNIRELMNAVTRAAVMAETEVIQADEIRLEGDAAPAPAGEEQPEPAWEEPRTEPEPPPPPAPEPKRPEPPKAEKPRPAPAKPVELNERQRKAWPAIRRKGEITRNAYQEAVGNNLASRTAVYDLGDLVNKGLLAKIGRGPATRYTLTDLGRDLAY